MPEGHIVHADAARFTEAMGGQVVRAASPQGRFTEGAAVLDGRTLLDARAHGKHLFLRFSDGPYLHVHLGLIGTWTWHRPVLPTPSPASPTPSSGPPIPPSALPVFPSVSPIRSSASPVPSLATSGSAAASAPASPGHPAASAPSAPLASGSSDPSGVSPALSAVSPPASPTVRLRLTAPDGTTADLRGVMVCAVVDEARVDQLVAALGPDPILSTRAPSALWDRVSGSAKPIGTLLLDQSVVAGAGLIWRCEAPFLARVSPFLPGRDLARPTWTDLWHSLSRIMRRAVTLNLAGGHATLAATYHVFRRHTQPCHLCHTPIQVAPLPTRNVWWCPHHQPH